MDSTTKTQKNKTAESIEKCLKTDELTGSMWHWASVFENLSIVLLILYLLVGFILTILLWIDYSSFGMDPTEVFRVIICFVITITVAFLAYATGKVPALIIASIASIMHNTQSTAKLTEYSVRKNFLDNSYEIDTDSEPAIKQIIRSQTGWICPECAREYTNDIDSCTCGYQKP